MKIKFAELNEMPTPKLVEQLVNIKKEMFNLRMMRAQGKLEKLSGFKVCRRNYAKVLTKLSQLKNKG